MIPLLLLLFAAPAAAEEDPSPEEAAAAPTVDPRDEEIFGAPAVDPRDEEIFGAPAVDPEVTGAPPPTEEERHLDPDRTLTTSAIDRAIASRESALSIGGRAWLRADYAVAEHTPAQLNALSSPTLVDLYLDARPNDRVRFYLRGRLNHNWTVTAGDTDQFGNTAEPTSVDLDQLYLKADVAHRLFITAGRQRIKWGAGRFWNPTDFMNQQTLDPLAVLDTRLGVSLIKLHLPVESAGLNLYALANLDGADSPAKVGGALRAEWLVGHTELSVSGAARTGNPLRLGADLSTGVGPFDLHLEGAVRHDDSTPSWEGSFDSNTLTFPTEVDRSDDWIPQVVAGAEISFHVFDDDSLSVGVEGFFNDSGYEDPNIYPWLIYQGSAQFFYLGRYYGAIYAYLPGPGRLDDHSFVLSAISNFSDQTAVVRLDWSAKVLTFLTVNAYVAPRVGGSGGEFRFALDIPATSVGGVETAAISIPPPLMDVGLGALVNF